jgi:hypothetical protein
MSDEAKSIFANQKRKFAEYEVSKISIEEYRHAVESLVPLALTDTSGGRAAAGVLLSCYNAYEFHLDVTDLCLLDIDRYQAAIQVIRGRIEISKEPHQLIKDGDKIFGRIWHLWEGLKIANRAKKLD